MLAIGLRSRFFLIIFFVLIGATTIAIVLYSIFLKNEKLKLIDQQVRETALTLIDSRLVDLRKLDIAKAEDIISEELGENKFGKFFIIRNDSGAIYFQSASARLLPVSNIPRSPQWISLHKNENYIRVLNLKLPRFPNRTLQVGLVIDHDLLGFNYFSQTGLIFYLSVLSIGLLIALFLTSTLLGPIKSLSQFVGQIAVLAETSSILPAISDKFLPAFKTSVNSKDEFINLLQGLEILIEKINRNYRISRQWSYQMAHELKTPLAVIKAETESAWAEKMIRERTFQSITEELKIISDTISTFLNWVEIEYSNRKKTLHANRISKTAWKIKEHFEKNCPERIQITVIDDFYVFSDPGHLEQVINNLVSNALNYSPRDTPVRIIIDKHKLTIIDQGPGISKKILDRIGEPFNRETGSFAEVKGHGLGLAWIFSISKLYDWKITIHSENSGTEVSLLFFL